MNNVVWVEGKSVSSCQSGPWAAFSFHPLLFATPAGLSMAGQQGIILPFSGLGQVLSGVPLGSLNLKSQTGRPEQAGCSVWTGWCAEQGGVGTTGAASSHLQPDWHVGSAGPVLLGGLSFPKKLRILTFMGNIRIFKSCILIQPKEKKKVLWANSKKKKKTWNKQKTQIYVPDLD